MQTSPPLRLAVDIGGTFTDIAVADGSGRIVATLKTPTTPAPAMGALFGSVEALGRLGRSLGDLSGFVHGTTLATNALIERRGAVTAALTTEGFRDILEIAYERRYAQYDIDIEKPDLIVPRSRCFTIAERMDSRGQVLLALDEDIDALLEQIDASGAGALAICLLHSYANPAHERRLRDMIAVRRPDLAISLSSDVSPEAREFDRLSTTVANAYIQPLMAGYLAEFVEQFADAGLTCPILMMTSGGGMTTIETARRLPIRLVESGPSGGAVLAAKVAAEQGLDQVLSFDMGGTTAKLCLIDNARPQTARNFEIARAARFIKGSGMPVRIPVVEMIEIGAGGGSIAGRDMLGRVTVGPLSAGSDPGPAAFQRGGVEATVTDADATLGYLDPDRFAEARLTLDVATARAAIAHATALEPPQGAAAISQTVDEAMASAARMHGVENGKDLAPRTMIAFGGNGPLHATRVARRAGVSRILIPPDPGVGSAVGFLFAPVSFEIVRSRYTTLDDFDMMAINAVFDAMVAEASDVVQAGAPGAPITVKRTAFMRYRGQGHEVEIDLADRALTGADLPMLRAAFEEAYRGLFSRAVPGMVIEVLNWAVHVSADVVRDGGDTPLPPVSTIRVTQAEILCDETGATQTATIHDRASLTPGRTIPGPALIVEPQTTTLVGPAFAARMDPDGNLILTRSAP